MPALYLFHRRTLLGGDDLQPAAFVTICLRCFQLTFLLGPIFHHIARESHESGGLLNYILYDPSDDASCRHTHYFALLLVAHSLSTVAYSLGTIVLEWSISYWSSRGSPTETEPRSTKVTNLLECKLIPFSILLFVIWTDGVTAISFAPSYLQCVPSKQQQQQLYNRHLDDLSDAAQAASKLSASHIQLWLVCLVILLLSQITEVLFSWTYLFHLCRQPRQIRGMTNNNSSWHESDIEFSLTNHELVEEMWADRCSQFCQCLSAASCFLFGGRELAGQVAQFGDVARALADYLETRGVLDVVPSDIVTGLIVLQQLQQQRIHEARQQVLEQDSTQVQSIEEGFIDNEGVPPAVNREDDRSGLLAESSITAPAPYQDSTSTPRNQKPPTPAPSSRQSLYEYRFERDGTYQRQRRVLLDRRNFADMYVLEEGARYAKYALCIYTWVLYLYVHPITGPARLLAKSGGSCCYGRKRDGRSPRSPMLSRQFVDENERIEGDNMCESHKSAMLLTAGLTEADLVYAQLRSGFSETPYCILLDHQWKCIVVSVRGTFSLEDCVTDVLIQPESLETLGREFNFDGRNQYCHGGVLTCVRNVYRDLLRHGLLDELLGGERPMYPDYTLRLVGHSLGAATCTLLSYMMRPKFPGLRVVNYSPPGCTFTWDMATGCKEWCSSFVLDCDLVPRLSLDAMERLRDEILELLGRIKVPKFEVAKSTVGRAALYGCNFFWNTSPGEINMQDILHEVDEVPPSDYRAQLQRFQEIQRERRETRGIARSTKLFPPGKMIHLTKIGERRTCLQGIAKCLTCCTTSFGFKYLPVWVENDDLNEILVGPTMGTDHFPNRMNAVLESVASNFGLESL